MTDEERLEAIKKLSTLVINPPCGECMHSKDRGYTFATCREVASRLSAVKQHSTEQHEGYMRLKWMRGDQGLCGPTGLLFESAGFRLWKSPNEFVKIPFFIVSGVLAVIAFVVFLARITA